MARFSHPSIFKANNALRDFEVMGDGICRPMASPPKALLDRFPYREPYRLYRFLSDLDDLVDMVPHDLQDYLLWKVSPYSVYKWESIHPNWTVFPRRSEYKT